MVTCVFEDGGKGLLRHITVGALIIKENKILLIKRASHLINPGKYALPGGFMDRDETTVGALKREIKEETGFEIKKFKLFRINDNPNRIGEDRQNVDFIFLAEVGEKLSDFDKEVVEFKWFDLNHLPDPSQFAFDHLENIELYLKYLKNPFSLPIFPS